MQQFLCLCGDDNKLMLVNLAQVRTVQLVEGACQLVFEPSHVVNVGGKGALEILLTLAENGFLPNGQDASELVAGIRDALKDRASVDATSVKVQRVGSVEQ